MTNEPAEATTISPPTSKVNSPSNTKAHSSSQAWVCGGIISPGARPTSMIVKAPPKLSAVTLWVMSKTGRWAPSCGPIKIFLLAATVCAPFLFRHLTQGFRTLAGRLGGARGLPGARALGLLWIVGLRRWQKLDPAFAADGRQPLEIRRRAGRRRVARVVDRLGHGGEEAGVVACGRDQCQGSHHAWSRVVRGMQAGGP